MINLLPDNEKKAIDREYKLRHLIVILWACLFFIIATGLFMLPSYVLTLYKGKASNSDIAKAAALNQAEEQKSKKEIDDAKSFMKVLQPVSGLLLPTNIIAIINKDKTPNNTISNISYSRADDGSAITILVKGVSKTRQSLSQFKEALTHETGITSVDIPVSNFAKESNIDFTITLISKIQ